MWKPLLIFLCVTVGLLGSCSTEGIKCTATQTPEGTHYSVPGYTELDCDYSWIKNGIVIANTIEKNEDVLTWSNCTLQTNKCFEEINYQCHCLSGTELIANCTTSCTGNAGLKGEGIPASRWLVPLVVVLLLLFGVFLVIAYKCGVFSLCGQVNQPNHQGDGNVI